MTARRINVVPHTHWDREWYEPFQTFRLKLVDLLDHLIPLLESDPAYARYLLDGQMAVVDDYLEVRPEMEDRLRRLAASGRVAMGPWYILVDEFQDTNPLQWLTLRQWFDASAEVRHVGEQDRVANEFELPTDDYTLLNLSAAVRPFAQKDVTLFAEARNLTNEEAREHASFLKDIAPLPGRNLRVGVAYRF